MNLSPSLIRRAAILYFGFQAFAVAAWWVVLFAWPPARAPFKSADAPDSVLLAFVVADLSFVAAASGAVTYGLVRRSAWTWPVLLLHTGAAAYASLYCLTVFVQNEGSGWLAAVLMLQGVTVIPWFAWRLRPQSSVER